jgi:hypothetical protein
VASFAVALPLHGMGDPVDLARKYGSAIQSTKLHPSNQPSSVTSSGALGAKGAFDLAALDRTIGYTGKANGPVYKYVVGRDDLRVIAMGAEVTTATERHTQGTHKSLVPSPAKLSRIPPRLVSAPLHAKRSQSSFNLARFPLIPQVKDKFSPAVLKRDQRIITEVGIERCRSKF